MQFVLDEGLPRLAATLLSDAGHPTHHVTGVLPTGATDIEILAWALQNAHVVVTLDADFHSILAAQSADGPSVIRLRLQGLKAHETVAIVLATVDACTTQLVEGAAVAVDAHSIRIHRLPLGRPPA